jgi:hypothetical protein
MPPSLLVVLGLVMQACSSQCLVAVGRGVTVQLSPAPEERVDCAYAIGEGEPDEGCWCDEGGLCSIDLLVSEPPETLTLTLTGETSGRALTTTLRPEYEAHRVCGSTGYAAQVVVDWGSAR